MTFTIENVHVHDGSIDVLYRLENIGKFFCTVEFEFGGLYADRPKLAHYILDQVRNHARLNYARYELESELFGNLGGQSYEV